MEIYQIHLLEMETIDVVLIILAIICIIAIVTGCCCSKRFMIRNPINRCPCSNEKEGFISSGSDKAYVQNNAIVGPRMYATQIIDNGKTFDDMLETANNKHIASDGPGTLGAGKGEGFDNELKNQSNYKAYMNKKGRISNEEVNKITKSINAGISNSGGNISLFNRGKQVAGKLIIQDGWNSTIAMMDDKYYSERQKNRNIYTTTKVIHAKGFDINPENIGRELSDYKPSKMLSRHNKKIPYVSEASRPSNGISVNNGKLTLETNKATVSTDVGNKHVSDGAIEAALDNGQKMIGMKSSK